MKKSTAVAIIAASCTLLGGAAVALDKYLKENEKMVETNIVLKFGNFRKRIKIRTVCKISGPYELMKAIQEINDCAPKFDEWDDFYCAAIGILSKYGFERVFA